VPAIALVLAGLLCLLPLHYFGHRRSGRRMAAKFAEHLT
jgi:hypothetical protein